MLMIFGCRSCLALYHTEQMHPHDKWEHYNGGRGCAVAARSSAEATYVCTLEIDSFPILEGEWRPPPNRCSLT